EAELGVPDRERLLRAQLAAGAGGVERVQDAAVGADRRVVAGGLTEERPGRPRVGVVREAVHAGDRLAREEGAQELQRLQVALRAVDRLADRQQLAEQDRVVLRPAATQS